MKCFLRILVLAAIAFPCILLCLETDIRLATVVATTFFAMWMTSYALEFTPLDGLIGRPINWKKWG